MPEKLSRREFIRRTVTAGCGLGLLGCVKPALANYEINLIDQPDSNLRENIENRFDRKWFREYQQFEELLRKNNIKEKLEWLQRKYKKNLSFFEIAANINSAVARSQIITDEIQRLAQNEKNWDQTEKQASVENINQQGLELLAEIKADWLFSLADKKQELLQSKIQFKGFKDGNIDLQKLEAILNTTYPQDIMPSHIAEINWFDWQKSQEIKFKKWKNLEFPGRDREELDLIHGLVNRPAGKIRSTEIGNFAWGKKEVHIYSIAKFPLAPQQSLQDTIEVINHEVFGHAADWAHSPLLNNFQRIDYFYKIAQRLEKGNNLYSSPQTEQMCQKVTNDYTKIEEYNAYLFQAYYNDPEKLLKNHPEDFELADEMVKIFDPSFDAFKKHALRKQLLEK